MFDLLFLPFKNIWQKYLKQVSTLDLVAVLGGGKLLHVLAVLVGHHDGGH